MVGWRRTYVLFLVFACSTPVLLYNSFNATSSSSHLRWRSRALSARGILICVHEKIVPMAGSLVQELRALGAQEDIHLYHCNQELSHASQSLLRSLDAKLDIIDACAHYVATGMLPADKANDFRSFFLKPMALIHTSFAEVMLLDADDILFDNPSRLWTVPGYQSTGTLFFYDREIWKKDYLNHPFDDTTDGLRHLLETFDYSKFHLPPHKPSEHLLQSLAYRNLSGHEQDSSIAGAALDVMWELLLEEHYKYEFTYGDKELFWLSYELSGLPYFFSPYANTVVSAPEDLSHPDTLCGGLGQWFPVESNTSQLLYVNSAALINPYIDYELDLPDPIDRQGDLVRDIPSLLSRKRHRSPALERPFLADSNPNGWPQECLVDRGFQSLSPKNQNRIYLRILDCIDVAVRQLEARVANSRN